MNSATKPLVSFGILWICISVGTAQPEVSVLNRKIGQMLGRNTILECHAIANPIGTIIWKKDGVMIRTSGRKYLIEVYPKGPRQVAITLLISSLERSDYGDYTCEAENRLGKSSETSTLYEVNNTKNSNSQTAVSVVNSEEEEEDKNEGVIIVLKGQTATFTCSYTFKEGDHLKMFDPDFFVMTKDGKRIVYDERIIWEMESLGSLSFHIRDVRTSDHGVYKCLINTEVVQEYTFILHVPEKFDSSSKTGQSLIGKDTTVRCSVESHPPAKIIWRKDGKEITHLDGKYLVKVYKEDDTNIITTLTIVSVETKDLGRYACEAQIELTEDSMPMGLNDYRRRGMTTSRYWRHASTPRYSTRNVRRDSTPRYSTRNVRRDSTPQYSTSTRRHYWKVRPGSTPRYSTRDVRRGSTPQYSTSTRRHYWKVRRGSTPRYSTRDMRRGSTPQYSTSTKRHYWKVRPGSTPRYSTRNVRRDSTPQYSTSTRRHYWKVRPGSTPRYSTRNVRRDSTPQYSTSTRRHYWKVRPGSTPRYSTRNVRRDSTPQYSTSTRRHYWKVRRGSTPRYSTRDVRRDSTPRYTTKNVRRGGRPRNSPSKRRHYWKGRRAGTSRYSTRSWKSLIWRRSSEPRLHYESTTPSHESNAEKTYRNWLKQLQTHMFGKTN